jgi:tryptophan halogenase
MAIPDSLAQKLELWKSNARVFRENQELFSEISWVEVLLGQRIVPRGYHPLVDTLPPERVAEFLAGVKSTIARCVEAMPTHEQFIAEHCRTALPVQKAMAKAPAING